MTDPIDHNNDLIDRYAGCPALLDETLNGLAESDLDLTEAGEGWSIRQYIHHIADGDDIWKLFIKRAIGCQQGTFHLEWYWQMPQDEWAKAWNYAGRSVEPSLEMFRANRAYIAQLLYQVPGALEKRLAVYLPDGKEELASVEDVVAMQTRHVEGHVQDIQRILATRQVKPT